MELRILTVALMKKDDCWVLCRKTELIFLSSGIWTHNFQSRRSEMDLRTLTLAVMQKKCLLIIVSENWTHILSSGIWTHNFKSRKSEMHCVEHWAKKISKTTFQSLFKTRWDTLGNH